MLAPLAPHGSWLVLKALPLALLAPGVLRGDRRARQWLALLLPFYVAEAIARAIVEQGGMRSWPANDVRRRDGDVRRATAWFRRRSPFGIGNTVLSTTPDNSVKPTQRPEHATAR